VNRGGSKPEAFTPAHAVTWGGRPCASEKITSKLFKTSTHQSTIQLSMHIVHCVATCETVFNLQRTFAYICYIPIIHHYSSIFIIIHLNLMNLFEPPSFSKYSPNFHAPHTPRKFCCQAFARRLCQSARQRGPGWRPPSDLQRLRYIECLRMSCLR